MDKHHGNIRKFFPELLESSLRFIDCIVNGEHFLFSLKGICQDRGDAVLFIEFEYLMAVECIQCFIR